MSTKDQSTSCPLDLSHDGAAPVFVHPQDYDAFMMSQPDAVEALRDKHRMMSVVEEVREKIDNLLMDVASWSKEHGAQEALLAPRMDDALIVIVAPDDDESGEFQKAVGELDLAMFDKYSFRLSFMMFRDSEAYGLSSFVDQKVARRIYPNAKQGRTPQGGE